MSTKRFKFFIILFHGFILIAAGHGLGIMAILDVAGFLQLILSSFKFTEITFFEDFGNQIAIGIIFSLLGKLFLIVSFFIKLFKIKKIVAFVGIVFLITNFILFLSNDWHNSISTKLVFWSSLPFLISVSFYTFYTIKNSKAIMIK